MAKLIWIIIVLFWVAIGLGHIHYYDKTTKNPDFTSFFILLIIAPILLFAEISFIVNDYFNKLNSKIKKPD